MTSRRWLCALIAVGSAARFLAALFLRHESFDLESARIVLETLHEEPFAVYRTRRWPYPPGYFPVLLAAQGVSSVTATPLSFWLQVPAICADAALAFAIHEFFVRRGATGGRALAAAALVAVGPSFGIASGYTVQIDAVAILPGVVAVLIWDRAPPSRATPCGLLIGLGALIKTVPIVVALGLLPSARDHRERLRLIVTAAAVPLVALVPWLVADPDPVFRALRYGGIAGAGGLSLVAQPKLGALAISPTGELIALGSFNRSMINWATPMVGGVIIITAALLYRWRTEPARACATLWLGFYAASPNFFFQYLVWGLPFMVMAGAVALVGLAEAFLALPHLLFEGRPWDTRALGWLYVVMMITAWVAACVAFVAALVSARRRSSRTTTLSP